MHELKNPRLPGFQQNTRIPLCAQKRRCFRGPYPVDSTLHEEVLGPRPDAGGFVVLLKVNKLPRVGWAVVARAPPACRPLGLRGFGGSASASAGQGSNPRPDKRSRGGERHLDIFWRSQLQERISTDLTVALGGRAPEFKKMPLSPPRPPRPDPARRSPTLERSAGHGQCAPGPKSAPSCRSASLERIGNFTYRAT